MQIPVRPVLTLKGAFWQFSILTLAIGFFFKLMLWKLSIHIYVPSEKSRFKINPLKNCEKQCRTIDL